MKRSSLLLVILATFAAVGQAAPTDLLLVAPDDATLRPLIARLAQPKTETRAAWVFWRGELAGKTVVLTRSGNDPLNAVAATTLALRLNPPRLVVVIGSARAHDPALKSGDIVVSERFAAFDGMISPTTALDAGSAPQRWKKLPHLMLTAGEKETPMEFFPADANAVAVARGLTVARGRVVAGVLGSAHQINREADRIAWIRQQWGTSCEDEESAHVAGCAVLFAVPVVGFRMIDGAPEEIASFALRFVEAWK